MALPADSLGDDSTLVRAVQAGDKAAYAELYRRHYASVKRTCVRRLGDLVEADEIAQAAFVRAFERIDRCAGDRRFGAWVQVIAHRLCIDAIRARARTAPKEEPLGDETTPGHDSPEEALLREERVDHLNQALAMLPARQREVVLARHLDERRPGEIAASLGLTVGAVDSLLLRGRRRLGVAYRLVAHEVTGAVASMPRTPGGGRALAVVAVAAASAIGASGGSTPPPSSPEATARPPAAAPARHRSGGPAQGHASASASGAVPASASGAPTVTAAPTVAAGGLQPVVGVPASGPAPAASGAVGWSNGSPPADPTPGPGGTGATGVTGSSGGSSGGVTLPPVTLGPIGPLPPLSTAPVVDPVVGTVDSATSAVGQVAGAVTSPLQSVVTIPPLGSILP